MEVERDLNAAVNMAALWKTHVQDGTNPRIFGSENASLSPLMFPCKGLVVPVCAHSLSLGC